ncbi:MAG: AAA family ATPase, partial [Desulfitobacterium sp.]|nr:AAA family ATPase [Desulfitobacterium sp.]
MIIRSIKFSGFKNAKERKLAEFEFGPLTRISGENYAGKTTIGEAICWALYGCSLTGNDKADSLLLNKDSKRMYVELDLVDETGTEHILTRERKGTKTTIILDGGPVKQIDLASILPDKNVFLAVFNLEYF